MSGLREQQKALRRQAISQSALSLFESQGFQTTTIEQIARSAAVSVPTVFAYFGSKQEILLEKLREADHRAISAARRRIPELDDPIDTICYFERCLTEFAFEVLSPALWREILPQVIALLGPDQSALPAPYKRVNDALVSEIAALLDELRGLGKLRADLDVDYAAFMLNDYGHLQLLRLCRSEPMDLERYWREVRESTAFMVRGILPA